MKDAQQPNLVTLGTLLTNLKSGAYVTLLLRLPRLAPQPLGRPSRGRALPGLADQERPPRGDSSPRAISLRANQADACRTAGPPSSRRRPATKPPAGHRDA